MGRAARTGTPTRTQTKRPGACRDRPYTGRSGTPLPAPGGCRCAVPSWRLSDTRGGSVSKSGRNPPDVPGGPCLPWRLCLRANTRPRAPAGPVTRPEDFLMNKEQSNIYVFSANLGRWLGAALPEQVLEAARAYLRAHDP